MKILTIVGARPQFIKAAAVSHLLRRQHHEILLHTGQHYDAAMSDRFFEELQLPAADIELGVGSAMHGEQTARMLTGIEAAITERRPDAVLVYGDTNSTLAGALAASKLLVPIAHVEAGLRSFNRRMPEEVNRVVTDRLSSLLFCPSDVALENLRREGITEGVRVVGDVMWDVQARFRDAARSDAVPRAHGLAPGEYCVATIHRAENTADAGRFSAIMAGLGSCGRPIILPAHPRLKALLANTLVAPSITIVEPASYSEMTSFVTHAHAVITDSGGLQKEAYWLSTPCVTVRPETEWVETVSAGWNVLVEPAAIAAAVRGLRRPGVRPPLYGEGGAAAAIADSITDVTMAGVTT